MANIAKVNTQGMRTAATDIEGMVANYETRVQALYDVGAELDQMWDGDASQTFQTQLGSDRPKFAQLATVVRQYIDNINQSATSYDQNEQAAIGILQGNTHRSV